MLATHLHSVGPFHENEWLLGMYLARIKNKCLPRTVVTPLPEKYKYPVILSPNPYTDAPRINHMLQMPGSQVTEDFLYRNPMSGEKKSASAP